MDIQDFIQSEQKYLSLIQLNVLEQEEHKLAYWRVQDVSGCDKVLNENQIDDWDLNTSKLSLPKVTDLPLDYSFKGYQEYCMKHGLKPLDIQEEIDSYFGLTRFIKRWVLYYNYAPYSYILIATIIFIILFG